MSRYKELSRNCKETARKLVSTTNTSFSTAAACQLVHLLQPWQQGGVFQMGLKEVQQPQRCWFGNRERGERNSPNKNWSLEWHWVVLAFGFETDLVCLAVGMWENTCPRAGTQTISLLTCFHGVELSLCYGYIWFSFRLRCSPCASVSRLYCLAEASFTVSQRPHASLSSLSLLALLPSIHPVFTASTCILSLSFSTFCFPLTILSCHSSCLCHLFLPYIKHALYLYLFSRSIPVCVLSFFPPSLLVPFIYLFFFLILFFMLFFPLRACWYLSSTLVYNFCLL